MCAFTPLQEAAGAQRLSDSFACSKLSFGRQLGLIEWELGGCLYDFYMEALCSAALSCKFFPHVGSLQGHQGSNAG